MRTEIIRITAIFFCFGITAFAQTRSDDFFPLAVGNHWTYNYFASDWDQLDDYTYTDSGLATYTVVSQLPTADSIVWNFQEVRNIVRRVTNPWTPPYSWSSTICDTTMFPVIEHQNDDHPLTGGASDWESVFYFTPGHIDSNALFRYYPSQLQDTFTVVQSHYDAQKYPIEALEISFRRQLGVTTVAYSAPGIVGSVPATHHTLHSAFLTPVEKDKTILLPNEFVLEENFPNPFNPVTTISFDNPTRQRLHISIYDVLGRLVETILNDEIQPGRHSIQWEASCYSSGVYVCVAQSETQVNSIRLVLLK